MTAADYGYDSPRTLQAFVVSGTFFAVAAFATWVLFGSWWWLIPLGYAIYTFANAASFVYTTRRGKFTVWRGLLDAVPLTGTETVADLGCGRGAVLNLVAVRVPAGRALGVDRWRTVDQSGNSPEVTLANARAEGVQVELITADLRALPIATGSVDLVVSSLAVHNVATPAGRALAIQEAARVVRPGGRLLLVDFRNTDDYAVVLHRLGWEVTLRGLGPRFWYGAPWFGSTLVDATAPTRTD